MAEYEKDGLKSHFGTSYHLASSAVDAMFTFRNREHDDLEPEELEYQDYKRRNKKTPKRGRGRAAQEKVTHESYLMNMPDNLPPLIRTLVGVNYPMDESHEDRRKHVRPQRNLSGSLSEEIKRIEEIQKNMEDQSVAMVAAAAAAAVWSEEKQGTVSLSLRMKVYNDEWEDALRWISSWGKSLESDRNSKTSNTRVQRVSKRRGEAEGRYEGKRNRDHQELLQERVDEMIDRCTEKCLGDQEVVSKNGSNVDRAERPLRFKQLSRFYKSLEVLPKFTITARFLHLSRNFIGVLISSAIIWLFRDARGWWKFNRYSLSLKELLEEERNDVTFIGTTKQQTKNNSNAKKKKKKWKRRDCRILSQINGSQDGASVPCLTSCTGENNRWPEIEEESDSDASLQEMYMMRGGIQRNAAIGLDSQSDQASKGTVSTSSCTTADSIQTLDADTSKPEPKDIVKKTAAVQPKVKSHVYTSPAISTKFPVPTAEQREEAAKRLREFQSKQLMKLIERKRILSQRSLYSPKMSMRDAVIKGLQQDQSKNADTKAGISPPPGLFVERPIKNNRSEDNGHGEDDDFGLKLTDILDEDDGDDLAEGSVQASKPSASRVNFDQYETKSVALGDLLAPGTFRDSKHSNTQNVSSYDPWNSPSRGSCVGNRTDTDFDHHNVLSGNVEVDANIQLQVSAREFMPSWGKEGQTSPTDSKIW